MEKMLGEGEKILVGRNVILGYNETVKLSFDKKYGMISCSGPGIIYMDTTQANSPIVRQKSHLRTIICLALVLLPFIMMMYRIPKMLIDDNK